MSEGGVVVGGASVESGFQGEVEEIRRREGGHQSRMHGGQVQMPFKQKGFSGGNSRGKHGTRHCVCRCIAGCCWGVSC